MDAAVSNIFKMVVNERVIKGAVSNFCIVYSEIAVIVYVHIISFYLKLSPS